MTLADELTQYAVGDQTVTFGYAADGCLTSKSHGADTYSYVWDQERRLAAFKKNSATLVEYTYNPTGTRRQASDSTLGVENYFYSNGHVLADYNSNWALTKSYILGPSVHEIMAMINRTTDPNTSYYFTRDRLGSTRELVNVSETVNTRYGYDSWGSPTEIQLAGGVSSQYRFTGREHDPTSGLYYYGARYYANVLGRFVSRDPMCDGARKHVQGYVYVGNNPVTLIDPAGNGTYTPGLLTPCSWYAHDQCVECCRARRYTCHNACNSLDRVVQVVVWVIPAKYGILTTLFDATYGLRDKCRDWCDRVWGQSCEDDCPPPPEPEPFQKCPDNEYYCCDESNYTGKQQCCPYGRRCTACRAHCGNNTPCDNDSGDPGRDDYGCGQWSKCETGYDGGKWKWVGTTGDAWDPHHDHCGPEYE